MGTWLQRSLLCALGLIACSGETVPEVRPPERVARIQRIQERPSAAHAFRARGLEAVAENELGFSVRVARDHLALIRSGHELVLRWTGIGRGGNMSAPRAAGALEIDGQHVARAHGDNRAWFQNGPLGVEHGFVIAERPTGQGRLVIALELVGRAALRGRYTDLHVHDARGRTLAARIADRGEHVELLIDDEGARYPLSIDPLLWLDTGKLEPASTETFERFAYSAAASGDTLVLGALQDVSGNPGFGKAYVFIEDGTGWSEQAQLQADDGELFDQLGYDVAIDGDTLVVGASSHDHGVNMSGAAYVFVRSGTTWSQQAELRASTPQTSAYFGDYVAIEGDTILVGATGGVNTVYVFTRSGTVWTEVAELQPASPPTILYPWGIALSGNTAVVGDPGDSELGLNRGAAYVFTGSGANWTEEAKLTSPQAIPDNARLGRAVDIDGDTIVLGAPFARTGEGNDSGAAAVFTRSAGVWTQERWITGSDSADLDAFGYQVRVDGDLIAVSAPANDELASDSGAAYIFTRSGGLWAEQTKLLAPDADTDHEYGLSLGLSGNTVVAGGPLIGDFEEGAARVFRFVSTGQGCADDGDCPTGFCVDGVCCNEACGGDSQEDCLACAEALTGLPDGVCGVALDDVPCLQDGLFCNGEELCASGVCTSQGDPCADPEVGDGDGDCSDVCDEAARACSAPEPENNPCDDGLFCTTADHCESGVCTGTDPCVESADGDENCSESCDEAANSCTAPDEEGASCAGGGVCGEGVCLAALATACEGGDACASGICTDGICCAEASCGAYRCGDTGDCPTGCSDTSECQPAHQCSAAGTCEPIADFELTDDGCSCSAVGRRGDAPTWLWIAALALLRRRRTQ